MKNFLAITALILSLLVVQGPLWRPNLTPRRVTATAGGTTIVDYNGKIEKAVIFQPYTATLSAASPGRIMIHALAPGTTRLLIRYQDGDSQLYQIVVLPGQKTRAVKVQRSAVSR